MKGSGTVILVPARDEEASLPGLFRALRSAPSRSGAPPEVLVVDNGSRDATAAVARRLGATVVPEPRPGYGHACQRGMEHLVGRARPPAAVLFLDADDWLAARQRQRLLAPVHDGEAEIVIGGRRARGGDPGVPLHARIGNWMVSSVLRGVYGVPLGDPGPCRAARFDALRKLGLDDPDFGWNVQMQVRALREGYRVLEIPIAFEPRRTGRSKISGSPLASARAGAGMLSTLWAEIARPPGGPAVAQSRAETKN